MKLLRFLPLFSGLLFTFSSCTDLEVNPTDSEFVETVGDKLVIDAGSVLESSYADLGNFNDQANIYSLFEHVTDEMIPPTRGVDWGDNGVWRTLHQHTWDATHAYILGSWNQLNGSAYKTNEVLVANNPAPTPQQAAEAKFLRAFYTYHVMDLWGQVPFREVSNTEGYPEVKTRSQAFDFIIKDLEEAIPDLPSQGPSPDPAISGKASKAAAYGLLVRMYLNKGVYKADNPEGPYNFDAADMDKVIEYVDKIEAEGYQLEDDFFNNFKATATSEVIFEVPFGSPQNRYFMTLHYDQNPSGWNGFTTLADFYDKFEDTDIRKGVPAAKDGSEFSGIGYGFLFGQQYKDDGTELIDSRSQKPLSFTRDVPLSGAATDKGIRAIKYHPATKGQLLLMRWAEFYLSKAEALLRKGNEAEALVLVNTLRAKRGASALTTLDLPSMLDERGRELYWEGFRRIDQVRFETFDDTWSEKTVTEKFRVLYPIPQKALDSNPNLSQNKGY